MLHVEQIKWFGTKNTTSEYHSGIIKEEDWWYELCNLCCHHRMGWLLLSWWNRGRQIPIFKASRKVDVLVATKMNISSIGVHSLMRVWNGWEKANMNTCHFGGEIKVDSSTDIAWDGGTSYQDNSIGKMHKVQERRCATPYSFENRDWLPYAIDSHAWEIAKAEGAESEAKEVLKAEHTAKKRKALVLRWLGVRQRLYLERRIRRGSASISRV